MAIADQVLVGKMSSLPRTNGQMSLFDLPQSFGWVRYFSAEEIAEFFSELFEALNKSQQNGNFSDVTEVLGNWKATADIKADPEVAAAVEQGRSELARGEGIDWESLRTELDL